VLLSFNEIKNSDTFFTDGSFYIISFFDFIKIDIGHRKDSAEEGTWAPVFVA
jgi:hypothetical protein